jgi:hypothetical protein
MSTFKLPTIEVGDTKFMPKDDIIRAFAMDASLKKTNEDKGYEWNEPVEKLQKQGPKAVALWKLLGSPTGGPLRAYIGLKPEVWKEMRDILYPVGLGHTAVGPLKKKGGRKSRSKRARKTRRARGSKKTRRNL